MSDNPATHGRNSTDPPDSPGGPSRHFFTDPEQAERLGYTETPNGMQFCPGPREAIDKSKWKPCHACGHPISV